MQNKEREQVNIRQKEFYDFKKKNFATKIWSHFRNGILNKTKKKIGVEKQILDLHVYWFGDLKNKKVLDLGCYAGNSLSMHLANNAKEYVAIDLSEKGINILSKRLKNIPQAKAIIGDFLSPDFKEKDFDLIYAYGVLHHFKNLEELIKVIKSKLNKEGELISYDPLETSLPLKIIRNLYRPFQSDRDWEWPFSKKVFYYFENAFEILDRRAILGKSKWFFLLVLLPSSSSKKREILHKWHLQDWERSKISDEYMFQCMHLTMLMKNKPTE
ncbi:methyltransferase family protein [Gramella sp. Hel_I_59]|uniref:class I SAM-dependent methyltransferase n=1 Tax=Gramella sp. Hel_I_59 TaxID=1249978 RepID=UPI00114E23BC|nr:class I SAM-dependent methyltransferase [Gramella sp. Hel_I_59]TQI71520.1 methyltransferase family protein [Gramella sp. Hel_I_59]